MTMHPQKMRRSRKNKQQATGNALKPLPVAPYCYFLSVYILILNRLSMDEVSSPRSILWMNSVI